MYPGVDMFSIAVNQYDNIRPFVVTVTNKEGYSYEEEITVPHMIRDLQHSSNKLRITGLKPNTKYKVTVKALCPNSHQKVISKRTCKYIITSVLGLWLRGLYL